MISHLLTETAVITNRAPAATRDAHGRKHLEDEDPVTTVGFAQQDSESDQRSNQDQATSMWWVFLPPGTDVRRDARITIAGRDLEVIGDPRTPTRPAIGVHHVEARCRLVAG